MDLDEVKDVKGIAISKKGVKGTDLTGQKGVGIWSGLSFFDKMVISTSKFGVSKRYTLTINFGKIFDLVKSDHAERLSVKDVMEGNHILMQEDEDPEEHGTTVTLHAPRDKEAAFLSPEFVKRAVQQFAPCRIDPAFKFHKELSKWYYDNSIYTTPIFVCENEIYKSYDNTLDGISFGTLSVNDIPVARLWVAINDSNNSLPKNSSELKIPSGFSLIQNGFTLRRDFAVDEMIGQPSVKKDYIPWYVGELHVTSEHVLPTLNRGGLQDNDNAKKFTLKVRDWYNVLDVETRQISYIRNVIKAYDKLGTLADEILTMIDKDITGIYRTTKTEEFEEIYKKEQKNTEKIDVNKNIDFLMYKYKKDLHNLMTISYNSLNKKWNEIRQDEKDLPTLSQLMKTSVKSARKTKKKETAEPSISDREDINAPNSVNEIPSNDISGERKTDLTIQVAINILRNTFSSMEPVMSSRMIDKVVVEFKHNLQKVVGDE